MRILAKTITDDDDDKCEVYKNASCDNTKSWAGPSGGPTNFFTTWNFYFSIVSLVISIIMPGKNIGSLNGLTIALSSFASSVTVFVVAQLLLGWNSGLKDEKNEFMKISFANKVDQINAIYHALPMLISMVSVMIQLVFYRPRPYRCCGPFKVSVPASLLFVTWLLTPIKVSKDSDEETTFRNKVKVVYNDPAEWILLTGVVTFYIACFFPTMLHVALKNTR